MIKNTQIYKLLDEYDALPSQGSWNELDKDLQLKYREFETMFAEGKSEEEINSIDSELITAFNKIYGDTGELPVEENKTIQQTTEEKKEENQETEKEEVVDNIVDEVKDSQESLVNSSQSTVDSQQSTDDKKEVTDKVEKTDNLETSNQQPEIRDQKQETSNQQPATRNQKQETSNQQPEQPGNITENNENENDKKMEEEVKIPENTEITGPENDAARMLEKLEKESGNDSNIEQVEQVEENNEPPVEIEKTETPPPEPYHEFIQYAQQREVIYASEMVKFGIPKELWHEDKPEIQIGSLLLRKTNEAQLMLNAWTVIRN